VSMIGKSRANAFAGQCGLLEPRSQKNGAPVRALARTGAPTQSVSLASPR
jgi:hypothetical protein